MGEPDVEDLVDLRVVRRDVEDVVGVVLDARDVDRDQIFGDLLPAHRAGAAGAHVEHLGPQPVHHIDRSVPSWVSISLHFSTSFRVSRDVFCRFSCVRVLSDERALLTTSTDVQR